MYQDMHLMMPELIPVSGLIISLVLMTGSVLRKSSVPLVWATVCLILTAAYLIKMTQTGTSLLFSGDLIDVALISIIASIAFCLLLLLIPPFKRPLHTFHLLAMLVVLFSCDVCIKVADNSLSERKNDRQMVIGQVSVLSLPVSTK